MYEAEQVRVRDYMTTQVMVVHPNDRIEDVIELIKETGHDGFPVVDGDEVVGYVSSKDIILKPGAKFVRDVMNRDVVVALENMPLSDAGRVMFRTGKNKLPVIDDKNRLVGILTNTDILRSHIERSSPKKVWKFKKALEIVHKVGVKVRRGKVRISQLTPTQPRIYADELEGRVYELKQGLTEPLIVIKKPDKLLLVDGHHRVVAAKKLGIEELDAYILELEKDVPLGMEKIARDTGLQTIDDIRIMDYVKHPLIEVTQKLMRGKGYVYKEG